MVPVFDIANHRPVSPCWHRVNAQSSAFELLATSPNHPAVQLPPPSTSHVATPFEDGPPAPEVCISYGPKSNDQLMEQYGFLVPGNPYDRLPMSDRDFGRGKLCKKTLQRAVDHLIKHPGQLDFNSHIDKVQSAYNCAQQLGNEEARAARMRSAAASMLQACGWRNLREYKSITAQGEGACLKSIEAWLLNTISRWPTSVQQDFAVLDVLQGRLAQCNASNDTSAQKSRGVACGTESPIELCQEDGSSGVLSYQMGPATLTSSEGGSVSDVRLAASLLRRKQAAVLYRLERKLLTHSALEVCKAAQELLALPHCG